MTAPTLPLSPVLHALRALARTGAFDQVPVTDPDFPRVEEGRWLHVDPTCTYRLAAQVCEPVNLEDLRTDRGLVSLSLCVCVHDRDGIGGQMQNLGGSLHLLSEAATLLEGASTWDVQFGNYQVAARAVAALDMVIATSALPAALHTFTLAQATHWKARLQRDAATCTTTIRDQMPAALTNARRSGTASDEARFAGEPGTAALMSSVGSTAGLEEQAVCHAWSGVSGPGGFYVRVPLPAVWLSTLCLNDCGPVLPGDTDEVLGAALALRESCPEGPLTDPLVALNVARGLTTT